MTYLLDTDHITIIQRKKGPEFARISTRIQSITWSEVGMSVVSFHEQYNGCHSYLNQCRNHVQMIRGYEILNSVLTVYSSAAVVPFDLPAATIADDLQAQKVRIGSMDLRISAIALANNLTVVTRNRRDFSRVPGLLIDDWTI